MSLFRSSSEILTEETEKKPNLYASNVLAGVVAVIAIACVMNELGVFQVDRLLMFLCLGFSLLMFAAMQTISRIPALLSNKASKYAIMSMVLSLVLTVTVLLNIHAVLAFVLPLLLATQYRSMSISRMALIGACLCCGIAPILSFLLSTWSIEFLTGYMQVFCNVTVSTLPGNEYTMAQSLWQIFLYWSLPQMFTIGAFGIILFSVTKSGIESVKNQIQVVDLSNDLNKQLESITTMQEKVLLSMSDIIENRDIETGSHVRRTIEIVRELTDSMLKDGKSGVTEAFCRGVVKSAPMHDLGKISIPDAILHKPGRLTPEEFDIVKQHPVISAKIISNALTGIEDEQLLSIAKNMALYHHERMDGTGYPKGLKGQEIPLEARIMAIADVYDALVSKRCYKESMSIDEAFETIEMSMGTQFDPALNPYFLECRAKIEGFYQSTNS